MGKASSEQLRKVEKIKPFGHSRAQKNKEMPHFDHFSCPGEIDPFVFDDSCNLITLTVSTDQKNYQEHKCRICLVCSVVTWDRKVRNWI